jgi:hypothetical protein
MIVPEVPNQGPPADAPKCPPCPPCPPLTRGLGVGVLNIDGEDVPEVVKVDKTTPPTETGLSVLVEENTTLADKQEDLSATTPTKAKTNVKKPGMLGNVHGSTPAMAQELIQANQRQKAGTTLEAQSEGRSSPSVNQPASSQRPPAKAGGVPVHLKPIFDSLKSWIPDIERLAKTPNGLGTTFSGFQDLGHTFSRSVGGRATPAAMKALCASPITWLRKMNRLASAVSPLRSGLVRWHGRYRLRCVEWWLVCSDSTAERRDRDVCLSALPLGYWAWAGRLICRRCCLTFRPSE